MASFFSGQHGQLFIKTSSTATTWTKCAKVRSWSLNSNNATLDTTTLEDTDRTIINGIRSTSGSCSLFYYQEGTANSAAILLNQIIKERTTGTEPGQAAEQTPMMMRLKVDTGVGTVGKYIDLEVYITSASMSMAVSEVLAADISFEVNGAPVDVVL